MGSIENASRLVQSREKPWRLQSMPDDGSLPAREHSRAFGQLIRTEKITADRSGQEFYILFRRALARDTCDESLPRGTTTASC
jgi:hypothetical protein